MKQMFDEEDFARSFSCILQSSGSVFVILL